MVGSGGLDHVDRAISCPEDPGRARRQARRPGTARVSFGNESAAAGQPAGPCGSRSRNQKVAIDLSQSNHCYKRMFSAKPEGGHLPRAAPDRGTAGVGGCGQQLLVKEKDLTRARDALAAEAGGCRGWQWRGTTSSTDPRAMRACSTCSRAAVSSSSTAPSSNPACSACPIMPAPAAPWSPTRSPTSPI